MKRTLILTFVLLSQAAFAERSVPFGSYVEIVARASHLKEPATQLGQRLFGHIRGNRQSDAHDDAFRHAFGAGLLYIRVSAESRPYVLEVLNRREKGHGQSGDMDRFNNQVGIEIAQGFENRPEVAPLARLVLEAIDREELWVMNASKDSSKWLNFWFTHPDQFEKTVQEFFR